MRTRLWFGSIICVLGVIPGWVVGALLGLLFIFFNFDMTKHPDFLYLRQWFGLEAPGVVWGWIYVRGVPVFIQGLIAGAVAIVITKRVYLGNRLDAVAIIAGTVYLVPLAALMALVLISAGLVWDNLHDILQWLGLAFGLLTTAQSFPSRIKRQWI
jgi:hypothetical protein